MKTRPHRVRFRDLDGADRVRSFATKRDADDFRTDLHRRRTRRRAGLGNERPLITYDKLCQLFLDQYDARSKDWFEDTLGYSRRQFGKTTLRNLESPAIGRWLHGLNLSPATKRHILAVMRQVCSAAVEWSYIERSPVRPSAVRAPRAGAVNGIKPFQSWAEVLLVAEKAGEQHGKMIRFAAATGLRPQEYLALTWEDIDLEARIVLVNRTVRDGVVSELGKTTASLRRVALSKPAISALKELKTTSGLVFPNEKGGYIDLDNWRARVWKPAVKNAKLEHRPLYQLRHTYATLGLAQGCSLEWISRQMGHTSIRMTHDRYARFLPSVDERMRSFLDGMETE